MSDDLFDRLRASFTDHYLIERELGRGGMAVVYVAQDLRHERPVAIKVLQPALSSSVGTERFLREIDVIAQLQHPNILTLIDSGEVEGLPYYVMPYVRGQSLSALLTREGRLRVEEAVRIAAEVADALESAHGQGVIHRDIKPSNVLLSEGHAVVADFGIAAALDESGLGRLTRTGVSLGSPVYMSPEQATGQSDLDGRTDIYALGCMLYEMLAGQAPFDGPVDALVSRKVLGQFRPLKELRPGVPPQIEKAVSKALEKERDKRFATAREFKEALLAGLPSASPAGWGRRRAVAATAAVLMILAVAVVAILRVRAESQRAVWAAQQLAEVENLAETGHYTEALALAQEVEAVFPEDTTLARLLPRFTFTVPIRTDPPGARVYIQDMEGSGGVWELLGITPLNSVRFAGLTYSSDAFPLVFLEDRPHRLRFELEGYVGRELLKTAVLGDGWGEIPPMDPVELRLPDPDLEGMVPIPGFTRRSGEYADFFMDRYEVTNRDFKKFVDAGGYRTQEYWVHPFVRDGVELRFEQAMALFRDQTGRPGPSTWRLGDFPTGHADYPVGGVSWHEAAAYARWAGKELPTTLHWGRGRLYYRDNSYVIVPRSNLGSDGPRPVGQNEAMTTLGVYDLAGNVREWCYNEAGEGNRATRGAAWPDAPFHVDWIIPKPAFDRDETNGFRLVRTFDDDDALAALRGPVERTVTRDYWTERPASEAEFQVFRRLYSYDPYPLNPTVERADTFEHWIREKVAFELPYGERGGAVLYLPRNARSPLQAVVYWGGSGLQVMKSIDEEWVAGFDYMVLSGRAVAVPIFKGAYERDDSLFSFTGASSLSGGAGGSAYRDRVIQWVKEVSATVDYLETREDIDAERVAYYGFSMGGEWAPLVLAVEPRIGVAALNVGGLSQARFMPEIDPFNFVPRVRTPVLMMNGQYDIVFPYETSQRPMFEFLGTPEEDKRHYVSPSAHLVPADEIIRETLNWFDRYLGVPGGG